MRKKMYYFLRRWNYWKSDKYLQWDCGSRGKNGNARNILIIRLTCRGKLETLQWKKDSL